MGDWEGLVMLEMARGSVGRERRWSKEGIYGARMRRNDRSTRYDSRCHQRRLDRHINPQGHVLYNHPCLYTRVDHLMERLKEGRFYGSHAHL